MQQQALTTSTACLAPTDCSVLLSALHGELHPDLHTCDGSKYVGSAHASVIPMFCGSVTGGALCPCVCERHPGVFGCKVSPARRSKWRVFFFDHDGPSDSWLSWAEPHRDSRERLHLSTNWVTDLDGPLLLGCNHTPMQRYRWTLLPSVSRLGYSKR